MDYFSHDGKKVCVTKLKGQSLIGYALVLTIVVTMMVGMNVYIKRGLQGKVRDMTNYFISEEHLTQLSQTKSISISTTDPDPNFENLEENLEIEIPPEVKEAIREAGPSPVKIKKEELAGGRTRLAYVDPEIRVGYSESVTVDDQSFSPQPFIPTDGHSETPEYQEEDDDYPNPWDGCDIAALEQQEQSLLQQAESLDQQADNIEEMGRGYLATAEAIDFGCQRACGGWWWWWQYWQCVESCKRNNGYYVYIDVGNMLIANAGELRGEVASLRQEAARIHERIEECGA